MKTLLKSIVSVCLKSFNFVSIRVFWCNSDYTIITCIINHLKSISLLINIALYLRFSDKWSTLSCTLTWTNNWHFATQPPLAHSLRNDVWGTTAEIPCWWRLSTQIWVVLLIGRAARDCRLFLRLFVLPILSSICYRKSNKPVCMSFWVFVNNIYFRFRNKFLVLFTRIKVMQQWFLMDWSVFLVPWKVKLFLPSKNSSLNCEETCLWTQCDKTAPCSSA